MADPHSVPAPTPPEDERKEEARPASEAAPQPAGETDRIATLLDRVERPRDDAPGGLRTARLLSIDGTRATIAWRGRREPIVAELAPELDGALARQALERKDAVLVETGAVPVVVGVLQTRMPSELKLKAATIEIEGENEVLIRSGRAALRLREDGDIEIVGSRISAASRGLFRLVGRILRLN